MIRIETRVLTLETEGPLVLHFEIKVWDAASEGEALDVTNRITAMIAGGKKTLFRAWPEAQSNKDFETQITHHNGYARFTVFETPGGWMDAPKEEIKMPSLGLANEKTS